MADEAVKNRIRRRTSIDIGSTNSQMVQTFEESSDDGKTWKTLYGPIPFKDADQSINFPTVILRKEDLDERDQERFREDILCAHEAERLNRALYESHLISGFKKDFMQTAEEKRMDPQNEKRYEASCLAYEQMLAFFRTISEKTAKIFDYTEEETILTLPVVAVAEQKSKLEEIAKKAGWSNVTVLDEIDGVLAYFMNRKEILRNAFADKRVFDPVTMLLIDIGGSTTDILLVKVKPDGSGGYEVADKWKWPAPGEPDTLGGIDIDKKLAEWFLENDFLLKEKVAEDIERNGYSAFRMFKESIAFELRNHKEIPRLKGAISDLESQMIKRGEYKYSKMEYGKEGPLLNREVFLDEIAKEYLQKQKKAIRKMLADHGVPEEDLDFICLAGGGSALCGFQELLLGQEEDADPLRLERIKRDNRRLLTCEGDEVIGGNPSAVCAVGNLLPKADIPFKEHFPYDLSMDIDIYRVQAAEAGGMEKEYDNMPQLPASAWKQFHETIVLAKENDGLPLSGTIDKKAVLSHFNDQNYLAIISLYSSSGTDERHLQKVWVYHFKRSWRQAIGEGVKKLGASMRNRNGSWGDTTYRGTSEMTCSPSYQISEGRMMTLIPNIKIDHYSFWAMLETQSEKTKNI